MKKAISLFLTVSMLCFATSAMAATMGAAGGNEKSGHTTFGTDSSNTYTGTATDRNLDIPCYRPGDTLSFTLSALTTDKELTVISYKCGTTPSDDTVQYINQYSLSSSSQPISYTVRNTGSGIYKLVINDSVAAVANFYYKVGDANVSLISTYGAGTPYKKVQKSDGSGKWSIGFIGKVTIDSQVIRPSDLGLNPGFSFANGKTYAFGKGTNSGKAVSNLDDLSNAYAYEFGGNYCYVYGLTIYNITNGSESITATAVKDAATAN